MSETKNHFLNENSKPTLFSNIKYNYEYKFELKYKLLSPIIKDIQMIFQLIKLVKNNQLSDIIFICKDNCHSNDCRFYFNYRLIIDFYVKVNEFFENDYLTKIKYNVYKTRPISKNFFVIVSLCKDDENENLSKLELEIILSKNSKEVNPKILNIIYNELNYNFLYLFQSIKSKNNESFFYNSSIIKNEYHILCQIMQNVKLIEYIINGQLKKIQNKKKNLDYLNNSEQNDNFIHLNEIYEIILNKNTEIKEWFNLNNISLKIEFLKAREDRMAIHFKILSNRKKMENIENTLNNLIIVQVRKLTNNSSFVLMKTGLDWDIPQNIFCQIKKLMKKSMSKIGKLCQIGKDKYNF
jgi:hypothetical protein